MKAIRYKENSTRREYYAIKCTELDYLETANEKSELEAMGVHQAREKKFWSGWITPTLSNL